MKMFGVHVQPYLLSFCSFNDVHLQKLMGALLSFCDKMPIKGKTFSGFSAIQFITDRDFHAHSILDCN